MDDEMLDVETTRVMEFSTLFALGDGDKRDFDGEERLLRKGRDLYECGRLRHVGDDSGVVSADAMDETNQTATAHVRVRTDGETITGMSCSCTRGAAPRCAHACAVCFFLFFRHRFRPVPGRTATPHEASALAGQYMEDLLGTMMPHGQDAERMAAGLETIIGFNQWQRWLNNDHTVIRMGNCLPTTEEFIDMETEDWPKTWRPGLDTVLPHGWFTLLEAAYEQTGNIEGLAKIYAVHIARGTLPQDARYVDRLRWLLGDGSADSPQLPRFGRRTADDGDEHHWHDPFDDGPITLSLLIDRLTHQYRPLTDDRRKPTANPAYEHLLREFRLSDKAVEYCETMRRTDPQCAERLAETIVIGHPDLMDTLVHHRDDWKHPYDTKDIDHLAGEIFPLYAEAKAPAYFVNGYTDPIIDDCADLIRAVGRASKARFHLILHERFADTERATIARDLMRAVRDELIPFPSDTDHDIMERAITAIAPHAEPLARAFFLDDDVVTFAPPIDEATLQREQPRDFTEALRLIDDIDGTPLTGDTDTDLDIITEHLSERIERLKTEAHFNDIVSAEHDDYDPDADRHLTGLRACLDVQVHALFGARYTLDTQEYHDLFDPAVTVAQRNAWLRPTVGQLGIWAAMYILRATSCKDLHQAAHLPHYLSAKGLKTAVIAMIDHMLGVTAMLGIPRAQVDSDEWHALHLLRIDPHPEATDARGEAATTQPGRDFTLGYMTDVLTEITPGLNPIDPGDDQTARELTERIRLHAREFRQDNEPSLGDDPDALALLLHLLASPEDMTEQVTDPGVALALAGQAKAAYLLFWRERDENDENPGDDPDGREAAITDATNVMLLMLEDAYTRLMDIADPGYKDW